MSSGAFFYANEIETGVDVPGHFAVQEIDDEFSGRRGFPVPRSDRRRRHRHDHWQAFLRGVQRFAFGHPFRTLVVADHFFELGIGGFVGWGGAIHRNRCDRAGVDELLDTGALGRGENIFRAADVGIVDVLRMLGPQAIVRGGVKDALDAFHGAVQRCGVAQIPGHILQREVGDGAVLAGWSKQHPHTFAARDQLASDVATKEACGAGNQRGHEACTPSSNWRCADWLIDATRTARLRNTPTPSIARKPNVFDTRIQQGSNNCFLAAARATKSSDVPSAGRIKRPSRSNECNCAWSSLSASTSLGACSSVSATTRKPESLATRIASTT